MAVDDSITKCCTKCGISKHVSGFGKHIKGGGGLSAVCRTCKSILDAEYRTNNAEKVKARKAAYYAANREKIRNDQRLYREANKDNLNALAKERSRKWRESHLELARKRSRDCVKRSRENCPEKHKESDRKYRENNPEKVRLKCANRRARKRAGGKLSKGIVERLLKLQRGKCVCCGRNLGNDYHIDHIIPLALGGSNTDDNIQLLRAECNIQKSAKHPVDFMQQRGFLI